MPASGEALRYLYFPKLVGSIGRKLTGLTGLFSGFAKVFQPLTKFPTPTKDVIQSEMDLLDRLDRLSKDRKSTRLNSSHANISYAVFCLKKKKDIKRENKKSNTVQS